MHQNLARILQQLYYGKISLIVVLVTLLLPNCTQMSAYATLLAHSKRLGVVAVIGDSMHMSLSKHFPDISIPIASPDCDWNWTNLWLGDINQLTGADFGPKLQNFICHKNGAVNFVAISMKDLRLSPVVNLIKHLKLVIYDSGVVLTRNLQLVQL